MVRPVLAGLLGCVMVGLLACAATSQDSPQVRGKTLVLPFRSVGVNDTTAMVAGDLLAGELEELGQSVITTRTALAGLPTGPEGCEDPDCAAMLAKERGAALVIYGSLSQLGDKIIVRARALRIGEAAPFYRDQLPALNAEELDTVMKRVAESIASGRPDSDRATVDSVILRETEDPRRRAGRRGLGVRGSFLFPTNDSYGTAEQLTGLRITYKFERRRFLIETTTLLGLMWGDGAVEWSLLDVFGAKIFGVGDLSPYVGGGLGIHLVHVEGPGVVAGWNGEPYETTVDQTETTLVFDVGVGLLGLRTYDFEIVVDLRYHHVFNDFNRVNGNGANGLYLSFGTSR